jgi:hypothetical protein
MSHEVSKPLLVTSVLLFIAIFVAVVTTQTTFPTGFAINEGNITVTVNSSISILLLDSSINFGNCTLNQTRGYSYFDSSKSNISSSGCDNFQCTGIYNASLDYLEIQNDGNVNINVTLKTNVTAGNVYTNQGSSTNSYYQYKTTNNGLGCDWVFGNQPWSYVNLSTANTEYQLCDNMSYDGSVGDSFEIYAGIWINSSANTGGQATWTFTASAI